jgi:3-methyladenine DNA glycosylase AlkD
MQKAIAEALREFGKKRLFEEQCRGILPEEAALLAKLK